MRTHRALPPQRAGQERHQHLVSLRLRQPVEVDRLVDGQVTAPKLPQPVGGDAVASKGELILAFDLATRAATAAVRLTSTSRTPAATMRARLGRL